MTESDAARIKARYPTPTARRFWPLVPIAFGLVGLVWLVWTGLYHALPPVSARVASWQVVSDYEVRAVLTVDRPDPSIAAKCTVIAQAADFQRVGQLTVDVPSSAIALADLPVTLKTLYRATSVSLLNCAPAR